jgi:oligosaccharide repeat unit polymerase
MAAPSVFHPTSRRPGASSARPGRLAGPLLLTAAVGAVVGLLVVWGMSHERTALLIALCLVSPAPIVIRAVQGRFDPFEPIQILAIVIIALFVLRPLAELHFGLQTYGPFFVRDGFNGALLIQLVGISALYLGYSLSAGRRLAPRVRTLSADWDLDRATIFAAGLLGFAVLTFAVFVLPTGGLRALLPQASSTVDPGGLTQNNTAWVYLGPYMTIPAAFIALAVRRRRKGPLTAALFWFAVAAALVLTVPRGQRTFILALIVPVIALPYVRRMRRPSGLAVVVGLLVAVLAMNVLLRERRGGTGDPISTAVSALTSPGDQIKAFFTGPDPSEFSVSALEYQVVPKDVPFSPGVTPLSILAGPVPKTIWSNKPRAATLNVTNYLFFQQSLLGRASNWPATFGDMYADYGFIAVALYSFLIGIGVRLLFEYYKRNESNPTVQLVFVATLPLLVVFLRSSTTDAIAQSFVLVGPILLCSWFSSRKRVGSRARPGRRASRGARGSAVGTAR